MPLLKLSLDFSGSGGGVTQNFEVPNADDLPASRLEFAIYAPIASHVSLDLGVPIGTASPWPVLVGMAMPEGTINENSRLCRPEDEVWLS